MCQFFSCISNGKGRVLYFSLENIVEIMSEGNKKQYDFNSHTSVASFHKIPPRKEGDWNKWEYDPYKDVLKVDTLVGLDDRDVVLDRCKEFFKNVDIDYVRNLFGRNSGDMNSGYRNSGNMNSGDMNSGYRNSGNRNSGDMNSGDMNSGYRNSGDRNSGNRNSGYMNSGNRNSGYMNSGNRNSGYRNSGNRNSGDMNSGDMNSGYRNSGNRNSGDMNSGDMNSGYRNSGNRNSGMFNTNEPNMRIFNKNCNIKMSEFINSNKMPRFDLPLASFVYESDMTDDEKEVYPNHATIGGYLKVLDYKEAWTKFWKSTSASNKKKIKAMPHFSSKIFEEITGISF